MCKAYPGPRCTNHVRKQLIAAQERFKALEATGQKNQAFLEARKHYADVLTDWDATPGGQKALKTAIETCESQSASLRTNDRRISDEEATQYRALQTKISSLRYRAEEGKKTRKKQTDLYNFYQQHAEGERFALHSRWQHEKLDASWTADNGDEIQVYNLYPSYRKQDYAKCAWRIRNGEPVAMIRFYDNTYTGNDNVAVLCDIEVSPFYRGEQLGVGTVKELDARYTRLHTSGSYSASGHRSLAAHVPLYRGAQENISPSVTHYEFVDWQKGDLLYP